MDARSLIPATCRRIPAENLPGLMEKIEKLNKRARKLKVAEIQVLTLGEEKVLVVSHKDPVTGEDVVVPQIYVHIEVLGDKPFLSGWTLLASLQHIEGEVILRQVPGTEGELPVQYRTANPYNCDHCHTKRVRNDTFLVKNSQTGEIKQIGRQCIASFLPGDINGLLNMAEWLFEVSEVVEEAGETWCMGGGGPEVFGTTKYLSYVAACIRANGWMSRTNARQLEGVPSTADLALGVMERQKRGKLLKSDHALLPEQKDVEKAELAVARAQEKLSQKADLSDYEHNLKVATKLAALPWKLTGIAASVIPWYMRELEQEVKRTVLSKQTANSQYVGQLKERLLFKGVTVLGVRSLESQFGVTTLIRMLTTEGNVLSWFASGERDVNPGDVLNVLGTVKEHREYQGRKETQLTRCDLLNEVQVAEVEKSLVKKAAAAARKAAKLAKAAQG